MTKADLVNLLAILNDAKVARKKADDANATLRHRLHEIDEALAQIQPTNDKP